MNKTCRTFVPRSAGGFRGATSGGQLRLRIPPWDAVGSPRNARGLARSHHAFACGWWTAVFPDDREDLIEIDGFFEIRHRAEVRVVVARMLTAR